MNAWGWQRLSGPDFGAGGEIVAVPHQLDLLAATACADTREELSRILARQGHRLRIAATRDEILAELDAGLPDVVLLDDPFCSRDDLALAREVRESVGAKQWIPLLLLTATAPEPATCQRAGIDDWLPKPLQPPMLFSRLALLGKSLALQRRLLEMHRFQTLFDHVLDGIVATDNRGIVESFNPAAEKIFGYRAHEVVGRNVSVLMPLPEAHRHDAYMARYRATEEATVMGRGRDISGKRKDGSLVPISVALTEMEWLGRRHFVAVIQDISERRRQEQRLANTLSQLEGYRDRVEEERRVTQELVERMTARGRPDDPLLSWTVVRAETFSGDIILSQRSPDGRLFVFAADAVGHGLPAAVGLLPVAGIFQAMAAKGLDPSLIAHEMNRRLAEVMPAGHAVAACLVVVDEAQRSLDIWTGGMPRPVLCLADSSPRPLDRHPLPLGAAATDTCEGCEHLLWTQPGYLVIYSDGLTKAAPIHSATWSEAGLCEAIQQAAPDNPFDVILRHLHQHLGERAPEDDILLAVLRLP